MTIEPSRSARLAGRAREPAARPPRPTRAAALLLALLLAGASVAAPQQHVAGSEPFATVGDTVITVEEYVVTLRGAVRGTFYHGRVPEPELARFQRRVADDLVDRVLLLEEAARRGVVHEREEVKRRLARTADRYALDPEFQRNREAMLAALEQRLVEDSLLEALEKRVRDVPAPAGAEVRAYFEANPEKFREPERNHVAAILLRVDPSAPRSAWEAAHAEATRLRERIVAGADFAELARLHSADASAAQGGDMGYLHRGMVGELAQQAIDGLQPGELTLPVHLLEGVALFRLEDREEPHQNDFDVVRERAAALLRRERAEAAWQGLKLALRRAAAISVRQDLFLPEPAEAAPVHGAAPAPGTPQ